MMHTSIITPFRVVLIFVVTAIAAALALPYLSVDLMPATRHTRLQVSFGLVNSSPDMVEQRVTSLLEGAFAQLPQLKKITSNSGYNRGSVQLYFDRSADMQYKQFEVAALIRRIYPELPAETSYPVITTAAQNEKIRNNPPFLVYSINAARQSFQVRRQAGELFRKELAAVPGISGITVGGSGNLQVTVQYDHEKCTAWGIRIADITNALQSHTQTGYPGSVTSGRGEQLFLVMPPTVTALEELEDLLVVTKARPAIRLKDIARVVVEEQEPQRFFRVNGQNSVTVSITAREGENKIVLARQIRQLIDRAQQQLPAGYAVRLDYDDTDFLSQEVEKTNQRVAWSVGILLTAMLLLYRNVKYLLILFGALYIDLSLTLIAAWLVGIQMHLYTIAGLAIAFGLMIDSTIVMIDYYRQYRVRHIIKAILASTLTTVAALSLIFLLPEEEQQRLQDFAWIVIVSLIVSVLVALWFTPALYELLFKQQHSLPVTVSPRQVAMTRYRRWVRYQHRYYRAIRLLAGYRKTVIAALVLSVGLPLFLLPDRWNGDRWYHALYNQTVGTEVYQKEIRPYVDTWTGGAWRLFSQRAAGHAGYRTLEKTRLYVSAELPMGNTLQQMNEVLSVLDQQLISVEGVDKFVTWVHSGQYGTIEISFKEAYESTDLPYRLKTALIASTLERDGVAWNVYGVGQAFNNGGEGEAPAFRLTLKGYNFDELARQSEILATKLARHKRVQQINTNERLEVDEKQGRELLLQIDERAMAMFNTSKREVVEQVAARSKVTGSSLSLLMDNQYYPLVLRERQAATYSRHELLNDPAPAGSGRQVRLKDFSHIALQHTAGAIHKENRQYIRGVGFQYRGAIQFGEKYVEEVMTAMRAEMPVGYTIEKETSNWLWEEKANTWSLLLLLIMANFLVCGVLLENLRQPFAIMAMVPVSFIGLFLVFSLGAFYFDQGGYAACIVLGGLAINAGIFIVNDYNTLRTMSRSKEVNRLLIRAAANRARTICLTTISTCCGLVPFLMEGEDEVFWFSLAMGTLGGMLFSLLATFIVLPVLLWKSAPAGRDKVRRSV